MSGGDDPSGPGDGRRDAARDGGGGPLDNAVAVIGMAGRFPGAAGIAELWENLCQGIESIRRFTAEETAAAAGGMASQRGYVPAGGPLDGAELFDAAFFGIAPREAELMDPQQRVFLECACDALEDAACDPDRYGGLIGVYAGVGPNTYAWHHFLANPALLRAAGAFQAMVSNDKDFLSTGVSYRLNLRGPSFAVQCACSTSLVAVHVAVQALLGYDCDLALAGGIRIGMPQHRGYVYQEGGIMSPDGHCRAFDERAAGTVAGNGVGLVVLKRLAEALADGDTVRAVIRGSAINNDGSHKVGFTAPSVDGQADVISAALAVAGLGPGAIGYVEAHGTGTALGDPIEVAALNRVFGAAAAAGARCPLGSLKGNLGHLDVASGVAGLIKTILALEHRQIPKSLHFERPNPRIDFAGGPFFVNAELREWPGGGTPRRAGVSSFGIGGTNAHVILEEAPPPAASTAGRPWQLLVLSAKTAAALEQATANLSHHLAARHPQGPATPEATFLADVAHTLQTGRRQWQHRRAVLCRDAGEAVAALDSLDPARVMTGGEAPSHRPIVFMFPGQGAQHFGMAGGLYRDEPRFREELDRCAELLAPHLGCDLRSFLFPPPDPADAAAAASGRPAASALAQPALFAVDYALAQLWISWGVRPAALVGHSLGEYVAACLAGVLTLADALALVAWRGKLMRDLPPGAMLSVELPAAELEPLLGGGLELASINGPSAAVATGAVDAVAALEERLAGRGVRCRRVRIGNAFHSAMLEPVLDAFAERVRQVELRPPALPYLSNVTGTWIAAEEAVAADYWVRHLRQTVLFGAAIEELWREPGRIFLEVGPGRGLSAMVQRYQAARQAAAPAGGPAGEHRLIVSSLPPASDPRPDLEILLGGLGRLWLAGVEVDWQAVHEGERRRRLRLPTYPFERQRYSLELPPEDAGRLRAMDWTRGGPAATAADAAADAAVGGFAGGEAAPEAAVLPGVRVATGTTSGKPRPDLPYPYRAPADERERAIADLWREVLGVAGAGADDDFFDLGGHSVLALHLASTFEERFGKPLPLAALSGRVTVRSLAGLLPQAAPRRAKLRVTIEPAGTRLPFWCVHPIGGTTLSYRRLARLLRADRPFIAVQAAGLDGEEAPCGDVEAMAARYLDEVVAGQPQGPYVLGGWSFGGMVAFEMSRQLLARGARVSRLVLIDTLPGGAAAGAATGQVAACKAAAGQAAAGNGRLPLDPLLRAGLLRWFLYDLAVSAGRPGAGELADVPGPYHGDGFVQRALEQAVAAGVLPSSGLGERLFAVFCANVEAAGRYVPRAAPVRAALIQAGDPLPGERLAEMAREAAAMGLDPARTGLGADLSAVRQDLPRLWQAILGEAPLDVLTVAANHYTMLLPPHVEATADCLRRCLEDA
ncbi:MAG TPA: beta-ketoacyl synthase N-terminal-like domain-containing protein [Thermoanaerobaculia bacterium]|nr:beta-ketoacyl synthase N-terminal-like domain-containing protein [Thermoanaerobaculia bacterium]